MKEQKLERTIESWAEHEIRSAPELRPTEEMYRLVEAGTKPPFWSAFMSRRAVLGTAVVSLVLLACLYVGLYDPFMLFHQPPSQEVAVVAMRGGFPSGKSVVVQPTAGPARRGPKGQAIFFEQLVFQFQSPDSSAVAVDMRAPREESIVLTPSDNYRLAWEPARDSHVYVFQLTAAGVLARLFPNRSYTSARSPLRQGQIDYLPAEPNWFYLSEGQGEERLYVVASTRQLPELEEMYATYQQVRDTPQAEQVLSRLLKAFEIIQQTQSGEIAAWVFAFQHR